MGSGFRSLGPLLPQGEPDRSPLALGQNAGWDPGQKLPGGVRNWKPGQAGTATILESCQLPGREPPLTARGWTSTSLSLCSILALQRGCGSQWRRWLTTRWPRTLPSRESLGELGRQVGEISVSPIS